MANFDIFVGRTKELAKIHEIIQTVSSPHLILIDGEGGVGKTFLLQKIVQDYLKRDNFLLDYYDLAVFPPGNLREATHIAESLNWDNFPEFQEKVQELANGSIDISDLDMAEKEQDALRVGFAELSRLVSDKKFLRVTDTIEASQPDRSGVREFFELASQIPNVIFITAGRNMQAYKPGFEQVFGKDNITSIKLEGFDIAESDEFFAQIDEHHLVDVKIRSKLQYLTNGSPVLLSLAVEWLHHDIPLPEIEKYSLRKLKKLSPDELEHLKNSFKFELVDRVRRLKTPIDEALLYMAHVTRRFNDEILAVLLDIPITKAQDLIEEISELSFVRYNPLQENKECRLHDEMKNLVIEYAWPNVDASGEFRKTITNKLINNYYLPRIQSLAEQTRMQDPQNRTTVQRVVVSESEWEQWRLEAECLYYYLKLSRDQGVKYFDDRYNFAQRSGHLMRLQFLIDELESSGYSDVPDLVTVKRADQLRMSGEIDRAQEICERLLKKRDLTNDNKISALNILGQIFAYRDSQKAEGYYMEALQLAEQNKNMKIMGILSNNLGQLYSNASQLDQAEKKYEAAIRCSKEANNMAVVASATNNLAFVYRLKGNLPMAEAKYHLAMTYRNNLGLERDMAYGYLTKAEIDRDTGNLEGAEYATLLAFRIFDKIKDRRGQAMVYRFLGNIERHRGNFKQSEALLDKGIELANRIGEEIVLARLYHVYGQEQRRYAHSLIKENTTDESRAEAKISFDRAMKYFEESQRLAKKYGDQRLLSHNKLEIALLYLLNNENPEAMHRYLDEALADAERLHDEILYGHVLEARGDYYMRQQCYTEAAQAFGAAVPLMAKYPSRETNHFFEKMCERITDYKLPDETAQTLAKIILSHVPDTINNTKLISLNVLCQGILGIEA